MIVIHYAHPVSIGYGSVKYIALEFKDNDVVSKMFFIFCLIC